MRRPLLTMTCILLLQGCSARVHQESTAASEPQSETVTVWPYQLEIPSEYGLDISKRSSGLYLTKSSQSAANLTLVVNQEAPEGTDFPAAPKTLGLADCDVTEIKNVFLHGIEFERVGWTYHASMQGFEYRATDGAYHVDMAAQSSDPKTLQEFDKVAVSFQRAQH